MVNIGASLNVWLTDELNYHDSKLGCRQGKSKRFTTLNAHLEIDVLSKTIRRRMRTRKTKKWNKLRSAYIRTIVREILKF